MYTVSPRTQGLKERRTVHTTRGSKPQLRSVIWEIATVPFCEAGRKVHVESYFVDNFGSIATDYNEDRFHCGVAAAHGVVAAQVDELFDVVAPKFIARGTPRVSM